ncbi:iron ABC transporter ATP-binding protein [Pseudomonas sp. StFLB209]|uniref:ABC transporter ATP-binding protein n=1 Tax=Pseudomonas sp. StFLB209 TaxID=1028989 RepID=UPI0004F61887|nr:ABC transporter ATP-binding protein [Pseudomonas sp. StFLB209]BAP45822.1 iron ABC transporter ATP-binding protein [Pseudomonas sp. StFLB209]
MNAFSTPLDTPALSCTALSYGIKGQLLLQEVSLSVIPGETLGLVGPNGSGKSTLLKLLSGIQAASAGDVQLGGEPLQKLGRRNVAQRLAVVEQQAQTADHITVRDVVELGRTPWLSALQPWGADDQRIVQQAMTDVDLLHLAGRQWQTLSGGERQRTHIARALAQQPQVLLLDEPTNHLDIQHQLNILGRVKRLSLTTVIALHDLNQALECDRLALLHDGRLVALGKPLDVLTPERLRSAFGVQGHWLTDPLDGSQILRLRPL